MPLMTRRSSARSTPRTSVGKCGSIRAHCSSLSQNRFLLINPSPNTNQYRIVEPKGLMSSDPSMDTIGQVDLFLLVVSRRSRRLNLSRVTRVSRLGWAVLVCTQALFFLAEPVWADPFSVVAVGASNTSGWTVDSEKAYPQVLEQMLRRAGYDVQITNLGRPFDTTAGMLARLDSAVSEGTDLVILQPGANDRRFFVSPERRANNIAEIKDHLRSRRIAAIVFDPV